MTAAHPIAVATPVSPRITVLQSTGRPRRHRQSLPGAAVGRAAGGGGAPVLHGARRPVLALRPVPRALAGIPDAARTWFSTPAKQVYVFLFLLRLWATRIPVVHTLHNRGRTRRAAPRTPAARWLDRLTTRRIRIDAVAGSDDAPPRMPPTPSCTATTATGSRAAVPASVGGRLLCFGLLRPYKGVEALLASFHDLADGATLRIVGNPVDAAMRDRWRTHAPRRAFGARLEYVTTKCLRARSGKRNGGAAVPGDAEFGRAVAGAVAGAAGAGARAGPMRPSPRKSGEVVGCTGASWTRGAGCCLARQAGRDPRARGPVAARLARARVAALRELYGRAGGVRRWAMAAKKTSGVRI